MCFESNKEAYQKADELVAVLFNLMIGTGSKELENATLIEARVRSMAIESALAANDIASAHHICLDTLVPIARQRGTDQEIKDVIWQSCFQTARFHSYDNDSTPHQLTYIILEQKRTLLAIALEFLSCNKHYGCA